MPSPTNFGRTLRELRRSNGYTQTELSAKMGVSHWYISDLEVGKTQVPSDALIVKVATAFSISSDALFWLANKLPPDLRDRTTIALDAECVVNQLRLLLDTP
jgi:transcriptional regulator with XRE-family HTH domain